MNVTPTDPMYIVMNHITDLACGEAPLAIDKGSGAARRRAAREECMGLLHRFVAMTMREGVRRAFEERGIATQQAPMKNAAH